MAVVGKNKVFNNPYFSPIRYSRFLEDIAPYIFGLSFAILCWRLQLSQYHLFTGNDLQGYSVGLLWICFAQFILVKTVYTLGFSKTECYVETTFDRYCLEAYVSNLICSLLSTEIVSNLYQYGYPIFIFVIATAIGTSIRLTHLFRLVAIRHIHFCKFD